MKTEPTFCHQCNREIYFEGICFSCCVENERKEILSYSQEEILFKIEEICVEIRVKKEIKETLNLFTKLVNYRDIDTNKIAEIAFKNNVFSPKEIYKNASEDIINNLINIIKNEKIDGLKASNILLCLSNCGGEKVFNTFLELEKNPLEWRKQLYTDPSFYSLYGGWTYDENENYIETQYKKCYPLIKGNLKEYKKSPVKIGTKTTDICKNCGCQIINILEIDGRDNCLDFLRIDGIIKIKYCPNCSLFNEDVLCRYSLDGKSELINNYDQEEENYVCDSEIDEMSRNTYILGGNSVPLRYAVDWDGGSSIGGFAFWIQDIEIKTCPDCGKPMKYLAQVQWETIFENMEGNAYIEICTECKVAAIVHQQR